MKKTVLVIFTLLILVAFFYPRQKYFGCGAVCTKEGLEATRLEEANTHCLGKSYEPQVVMDADVMGCYGVFLKW